MGPPCNRRFIFDKQGFCLAIAVCFSKTDWKIIYNCKSSDGERRILEMGTSVTGEFMLIIYFRSCFFFLCSISWAKLCVGGYVTLFTMGAIYLEVGNVLQLMSQRWPGGSWKWNRSLLIKFNILSKLIYNLYHDIIFRNLNDLNAILVSSVCDHMPLLVRHCSWRQLAPFLFGDRHTPCMSESICIFLKIWCNVWELERGLMSMWASMILDTQESPLCMS